MFSTIKSSKQYHYCKLSHFRGVRIEKLFFIIYEVVMRV